MRIVICGDIVPTNSNITLFESGNIEELFGQDILTCFQEADLRIVNLETPFSDTNQRIDKSGPSLCAPLRSGYALKELDISLASLANNHIFDAGEEGLIDTIEMLDQMKIRHVGAGLCYEEIVKPIIFKDDEMAVGIYSCCEHEFSVNEEKKIGANPVDLLKSFEAVKTLRAQVDYVIVLYHGGREQYRYPTPNQQRIMRCFVDSGASLVVAQHSHCIGCEENYNDGKIIYGQGNFIFDRIQNEYWNSGLIICCDISKERVDITYTPVESIGNGRVREAKDKSYDAIMHGFNQRSHALIEDKQLVEREFADLCERNVQRYIRLLRGDRFIDKVLTKIFGNKYVHMLYRGERARRAYALISCETHHEILLRILKNL